MQNNSSLPLDGNNGALRGNCQEEELVNTTGGGHIDQTNLDVWGGIPTNNATVSPASLAWRGEVHDDSNNSHKEYAVTVNGTTVTRTWGRIESYGRKAMSQSIVDEYETPDQAMVAGSSIIRQKTRKGYLEVEVLE